MRYYLMFSCLYLAFTCKTATHHPSDIIAVKPIDNRLKGFAEQAKAFIEAANYNDSICFLVDLSINSGLNRFFVYDIINDSVIDKGLVAHGHCKELYQRNIKLSNEPGCNCSSGGKYRIANRYTGSFGTAYKLIGLDSTNSNAYKRAIVLHGHECIPDVESYPNQICRSEGCPTVSPAFLKKLSARIDASRKPVLLWIFNLSSIEPIK